MKRFWILALAGWLPLTLGCQGSGDNEENGDDSSSSAVSPSETGLVVDKREKLESLDQLMASVEEARKTFEDATKDMSPQEKSQAFVERGPLEAAKEDAAIGVEQLVDRVDGKMDLDLVLATFDLGLGGNTTKKALESAAKYYANSDKVLPIMESLATLATDGKTEFAEAVMQENDDAELVATAKTLWALWAQKDHPKKAQQFMLDVANEHADVMFKGQKLVSLIEKPLFEIKHLRVGSTAMDISGPDTDGNEFNLSDYRGKVVLLDFWGDW